MMSSIAKFNVLHVPHSFFSHYKELKSIFQRFLFIHLVSTSAISRRVYSEPVIITKLKPPSSSNHLVRINLAKRTGRLYITCILFFYSHFCSWDKGPLMCMTILLFSRLHHCFYHLTETFKNFMCFIALSCIWWLAKHTKKKKRFNTMLCCRLSWNHQCDKI